MDMIKAVRISLAKLDQRYDVLDSGLYQGAVCYTGELIGGREVTHFFTTTNDCNEKMWVKAAKKK